MKKRWLVFFALLMVMGSSASVLATDPAVLQELKALRERLTQLEATIAADDAAEKAVEETMVAAVEEAVKNAQPNIKIGGALRVNYGLKDWDDTQKKKGGDFAFDTFRFNVDGTLGDMILSAEYRFYPEYDFNTIHHGYIGYNFTDDLQGQLGIHQVPFGLQPYASHNFWFSGAYYVGLEDDYDMGIKFLYTPGPLSVTAAFYKNGELGSAGDAGRYSVDVNSQADGGYAGAQAAGNEETNQGNLRVAYMLNHGEHTKTELGTSVEYGGLYNNETDRMGDHWAAAVHLNGDYGPVNVQLEYCRYQYNAENPAGFDDDIITLGGYSYSWGAPAAADFATFNVAYSMPVSWGPISNLTFYSDNTVIMPEESRFDNGWQNVVGTMISSGPVYTYIDLISAKNMIFSGGDMTDPDNERTTRLNINFGYYF